MSNIISSQVSYKRGPTVHQFVVEYAGQEVGTVERVVVEGKIQWQVADEPISLAETRDAAVTKFIAHNFELVIN